MTMYKTALRRRLFEQQLSQSGWKPNHSKLARKDSDILTLGVEISSGLAQRSVRLHRFLYAQIENRGACRVQIEIAVALP
jgi:hypothetical protein